MKNLSEIWQKTVRNKKVASSVLAGILFTAAVINSAVFGMFAFIRAIGSETAFQIIASFIKSVSWPYSCLCIMSVLISSVNSGEKSEGLSNNINVQKRLNAGKKLTTACNVALLPTSICAVTGLADVLRRDFSVEEKVIFNQFGIVIAAVAAALAALVIITITKSRKMYNDIRAMAAGEAGRENDFLKSKNILMRVVNVLLVSLAVLFGTSVVLLNVSMIKTIIDSINSNIMDAGYYAIFGVVFLFPYWILHTISYALTIYSLLKHRRYYKTLLNFGEELAAKDN